MINTEEISIDENTFIHTYSDKGLKIRQVNTGAVYDDAVDILNSGYTYEETDIPIEEELTDTEALNVLLGREEEIEQDEGVQIA